MAGRPRFARLDVELVRRGLARSREQAASLVDAGRVSVSGRVAEKPATQVGADAPILVAELDSGPDYASRGGHKLAGALAEFMPRGLVVSGRRCLDAGASTGGFTDVLLREDAAVVLAVDVGYGQLAWSLRSDDRVVVHDRTNVRELTLETLGDPVELVVGDLSFISLALVLPALVRVTTPGADLVLMVKPQFEVGRAALDKGGVVRDPVLHRKAVDGVAAAAAALGWHVQGVVASRLPGPAGNQEFFVHLTRQPSPDAAPTPGTTAGP